MALLKFPLNDEDVNYPARVSFQAIELDSIDVAGILEGFGNLVSVLSQDSNGAPTFSYTPTDTATHYGATQETIVGTNQPIRQRGRTCVLYLPQSINIPDAVAYDNAIELGILGSATEAGMKEGAGAAVVALDQAARGISSLSDLFTQGSLGDTASRLAMSRLAGKVLPSQAGSAIQSNLRVRSNPNVRSMFKQVNLRSYTLSFKMIPTSKEETESIKAIVQFFREELYPEAIQVEGTDIQAGYKFPNIFEIKMDYRGKQVGTKLLPAYLQSVNVVYNSSGMGFMEGGDFSDVEMTLSFTEASALTKQLVQGGY